MGPRAIYIKKIKSWLFNGEKDPLLLKGLCFIMALKTNHKDGVASYTIYDGYLPLHGAKARQRKEEVHSRACRQI